MNARGAMNVLRAAFRVGDGGGVIDISSGATRTARAGGGPYAASKAAEEQLALALAHKLGPRGVTVNVVPSGAVETDAMDRPQAAIAQLAGMTPLGRLGHPNDIGDAVAFLKSEDARWITGQNIQVNGGIL